MDGSEYHFDLNINTMYRNTITNAIIPNLERKSHAFEITVFNQKEHDK